MLDAETKELLEYATVFCKEEAAGTISNKNGEFTLFLKNPKSEFSFSFIGYNTVKTRLLSNDEILLQRAPINLNEVTIRPDDIKKILYDYPHKDLISFFVTLGR